MNLTIGRKIAFGFACALVALFAVGLTVYLLLQELNGDASLVTHTVEVQQRIQGLLSGLLQEESSARGYTLSPNPQFETLAKDAQAQITSNLRALRFLTQDNPHQQKRLDQLEPLITQRMNALQKLMDERSTGTTNEADQIALVNNGLETMGEMRGIMDAMMDEETGLLKQRQASAADKEGATYVAVIGGTLASAVFTVTAALLVSRSITRPLRILNEGAARIGAGDYGYRVNVRSRDEVGELAGVFNHMAGQVEERQRIQLEQDWLKTSLARFAMLFQGRRNPAFVSQAILAELATLVEARHSVLYTPEHDGTSVVLKPQAAYAADGVPAEVHPGQGLVGQCLVDKQRVLLTEVPPDYLKVNSALGATQPKNVLVQPALFEGELKGVLELASLTACTPLQLEFLAQLSDSIGTVLNTIEGAVRTEQLLEQSQALTENLRVQQVELSVKNEQLESQASRLRASEVQLQEQQEELQQTNEELEQANEEMQQTNEEMEEKVNLLAAQKKELERANRDIDIARKEVQEQAEKVALASKYKSDFLASMSHELRTPLNSLLILSKILSDNGESNLSEKQVQYARTIYSSGNDLLELINEILDLSRIESGKVEVEPATTALTDIRDFVESNFRHIAESKHLELAVELDPALPATIETDVRRVEQVLKNLLSNAFKFTEHGSVRFRAAPATSGWDPQVKTLNTAAQVIALAVSDTGIGIPADKQEAVFEAFQQADAGTARKYGGTGLGLSISRELAELLGGSIKLESTPGQGSTFTLFLPSVLTASAPGPVAAPAAPVAARIPRDRRLAAATPTSEAADGEAPSNDSDGIADDRTALKAGDRLLLIIEDDRNFANILMELAREKRFKVVVARNAAQGLAWARHVKPSAITLDLHLPDNDGWVVLDQLKHDPKTRHIPIHIISVDEERERSLRLGAVSYIQKPVTQGNGGTRAEPDDRVHQSSAQAAADHRGRRHPAAERGGADWQRRRENDGGGNGGGGFRGTRCREVRLRGARPWPAGQAGHRIDSRNSHSLRGGRAARDRLHGERADAAGGNRAAHDRRIDRDQERALAGAAPGRNRTLPPPGAGSVAGTEAADDRAGAESRIGAGQSPGAGGR